jgi:hypothetical protein
VKSGRVAIREDRAGGATAALGAGKRGKDGLGVRSCEVGAIVGGGGG